MTHSTHTHAHVCTHITYMVIMSFVLVPGCSRRFLIEACREWESVCCCAVNSRQRRRFTSAARRGIHMEKKMKLNSHQTHTHTYIQLIYI
jgi:hypothetical protein